VSLTTMLTRAKKASSTATRNAVDARDRAAPRVRQGTIRARKWAEPRVRQATLNAKVARDRAAPRLEQAVHDVRQWSAPRIEQAAHTFEESVAPRVSEALVATAHKIEPVGQTVKRRAWPRLLAGLALAAALGSSIAAALRRRRPAGASEFMAEDEAETDTSEPKMPGPRMSDTDSTREDARQMAEAEANGRQRTS
jgi:hypothetical protein